MDNISWVCQGCGKAFSDSSFLYELKISDMESCNRCGWKRNPKSPETLQREKDVKEGNIRDENNNIIMTGMFHRITPAVIDVPTHRSGDKHGCRCRCY